MVCSYQKSWEEGRPYLRAVAHDRFAGFCKFCDKSFSVKEGLTAVKKHEQGKKHQEKKTSKDVNQNVRLDQISVEESLRNCEKTAVEQRKVKDKALENEAMLVSCIANHGIPDTFVDCLSNLLPVMFPDSKYVKEMNLGRTKANYLLTKGISPHLKEMLFSLMRKFPFSLNFDESTVNKSQQLNINVSYRNGDNCISKANFTTVEITEGTTGEDIANLVLKSLEENIIPMRNLLSVQTDGCAAMLGKFRGAQALLREKLPHLPNFGGCEAHDACNILKQGVKKMMPELLELYSLMWANLEKHSMKKNREFKGLCDALGEIYHHFPKFLEVRFRYVVKLAEFMEESDRGLYVYYYSLSQKIREGKPASDTEKKIIDIYIKKYVLVRLLNKFIMAVGQPFIQFIDFFEARQVRVHCRFEKMLILLHSHLSRFLVNGGVARDEGHATASDLLEVDLEEASRLPKKDVFIGSAAEEMVADLGLNANSPELGDFYKNVFTFYVQSSKAMIKYFRPGLESRILKYMAVLNPSARNESVTQFSKKWVYLANKFPNVLSEREAEDLKLELIAYHHLPPAEDLDNLAVDKWFGTLAVMTEGGSLKFPLLSRLALALATIYNSSSEAERDFSQQNLITSGKPNMSQETLQAQLTLRSQQTMLTKDCSRCEAAEKEWSEKRKKGKHYLLS